MSQQTRMAAAAAMEPIPENQADVTDAEYTPMQALAPMPSPAEAIALAKEEAAKPADAKPETKPDDAKAEEGKTEESVAAPDPDKTAAEQYRNMERYLNSNPVEFMATIGKGLTAEQKAALIADLGGRTEAKADPVADAEWDDTMLSVAEKVVKANRKAIESLPTMEQNIARSFQQHESYLVAAYEHGASLEAKLDAVLEFLDLSLPDVDAAKIKSVVEQDKKDIRRATREVAKPVYEKIVKLAKAKRDTPDVTTLQNQSSLDVKPDLTATGGKATRMTDIFREVSRKS